MGYDMKRNLMNEYKRNEFMGELQKFKKRVLWKWESENLKGKKRKVKIDKWMNKYEIMDNKKIRMLIKKGGLMREKEDMKRGVNIIGIKIVGEKSMNMKRDVEEGYGIMIRLNNVKMEYLLWGIRELIEENK